MAFLLPFRWLLSLLESTSRCIGLYLASASGSGAVRVRATSSGVNVTAYGESTPLAWSARRWKGIRFCCKAPLDHFWSYTW